MKGRRKAAKGRPVVERSRLWIRVMLALNCCSSLYERCAFQFRWIVRAARSLLVYLRSRTPEALP